MALVASLKSILTFIMEKTIISVWLPNRADPLGQRFYNSLCTDAEPGDSRVYMAVGQLVSCLHNSFQKRVEEDAGCIF